MRPASLSDSSVPNVWHTPVPYLFGGFGAVMILIAAALIMLAWSHWRSAIRGGSSEEKPVIVHVGMEPRVAVVMAGDDKPSFIAKPYSLVHPSSLNQDP
ncbi:hypothetical protein MUK42_31211 [Musa troglodytarum]|uniref:Uncharacterized protein n=1 Tax=Musa troglodytarum TaxID=320322 RepID=A0A9E7FLI5_9LILI|nr:hypothetical protein MUK42_31211 [Musa troglodytarum]